MGSSNLQDFRSASEQQQNDSHMTDGQDGKKKRKKQADGGDYADERPRKVKKNEGPIQIGYSINITQEALRIGKLPTEKVARNMAKGLYNPDGTLKNSSQTLVSPRIQEMIHLAGVVKDSFAKTGDAP